MAKRKSIRPSVRFEIFKRDRFTCQYCGHKPPNVILEIDHVIPVSDDGTNDPLNLLTACEDCNAGKSNRPLTDVPPPVLEQAERRREMQLQMKELNEMLMEQRDTEDQAVNRLGEHWYWMIRGDREYVFGAKRVTTVRGFLKCLPELQVRDAMEIAQNNVNINGDYDEKAFRYFCGVCWNMIRDSRGPAQ